MGRDLRSRFDASPGHSVFIFFYNQQRITIQPENKTVRSVPPRVGRSVREPPQDGSEYKTIELIALRLRGAWVGEFYAFRRWKPELRRHSEETMASVGVNGRRSSVSC